MCLADSELLWRKEGQKLASTNPRFVARQLSHLPQLLTSAAVSGALSLQSARADPDLKKTTSAQVQNVLKFIISQNPLNAVSAAKQQLGGKASLPSGGKTLVKSPIISPAVSDTATSVAPPTSKTGLASATSADTSPTKTTVEGDNKALDVTNKTPGSLPAAKTVTSSLPLENATELVKSDLTKTAAGGGGGGGRGGGKASMLVGLLEGKREVGGAKMGEAEASSTVDKDKSGNNQHVATENKSENLEGTTLLDGENISGGAVAQNEKVGHESEPQVNADKSAEESELTQLEDGGDRGNEADERGVGDSAELVCEEVMPQSTLPRVTAAAPSDVATPTLQGSGETEMEKKSEVLTATSKQALKPNETAPCMPLKPLPPVCSGDTSVLAGERPMSEEREDQRGARKRTRPPDPNLSPPPKKTRSVSSSPLPLPLRTPLPSSSAPLTSSTRANSLPSHPDTTSVTTATNRPVTPAVSQPPNTPPLLRMIQPYLHLDHENLGDSGEREGLGGPVVRPEVSKPVDTYYMESAPLKVIGGVTVQPLPPSLTHSLPPVCMSLPIPAARTTPTTMQIKAPSGVGLPLPNSSFPPLSNPTPATLTTPTQSTLDVNSTSTRDQPNTNLSLQLLQPSSTSSSVPLHISPPQTMPPVMSTTSSDEALIRQLCSEAVVEETTEAALASQLGLGFLDQNLLRGIDLMQLINSPFETKPPSLGEEQPHSAVDSPMAAPPGMTPGLDPLMPVGPPEMGRGGGDTTQLLSEALTSLSTPSTPVFPSSLPPFNPTLSSPTALSSPLVSSKQPDPTPSPLTSHSSPFIAPTPTILTPHTPSLLTPHTPSPLTPEIMPNLDSLSEEELLEGIPPELAETIQALAHFDQQNYQSPLQ